MIMFRNWLMMLPVLVLFGVCPRNLEAASILADMGGGDQTVVKKTNEGIEVTAPERRDGEFMTSKQFRVPCVITTVVKTDSTNIRLKFGDKGRVIFNWETKPTELRFDDPKSGMVKPFAGKGEVPTRKFVTIQWILDEKETRVLVNGEERGKIEGNYLGVSGKIGVYPAHGSTITIKSVVVSGVKDKPDAGRADSEKVSSGTVQDEELGPIDVEVPTEAAPSKTKNGKVPAVTPITDPNVIERPQFANTPKGYAKSITSVTAMMVRIAEDGESTGLTTDIIGTISAESKRGNKAGIGMVRQDGNAMTKTALQEAVRAIQLRYPLWEPGHIDLSFGDKYAAHGGPSMGTAFGILMLSLLEGIELDPKCAVTGDITVDWKVRKVGGVASKIRGAARSKCAYAIIPEENEGAVSDMALLYGNSSLWNVQVFSVSTLQGSLAVARKDRSAELTEAMTLFESLKAELTKDEETTLKKVSTQTTLKKILELAPNHLSAKAILAVADGTAPKTLSVNATLYKISAILYPFRLVLAQWEGVDRTTLPVAVTVAARKRLASLKPIADKSMLPLLQNVSSFIESVDGYAEKTVSATSLKTRIAALQAKFTELSTDPDFMDKLYSGGY